MSAFIKKPRFRVYISIKNYIWFLFSLLLKKSVEKSSLAKLSDELKEMFGVQQLTLVPQARVGIHLAIKSVIHKDRNQIILSPYTIADVINMVISAGGVPVFADIDSKTCNITTQNAEKLINNKTAAILITHLHGISAECDAFKSLCEKNNLKLIEDAAQAFGAKYQDRMVGSYGDIGIFSFGRYKNITSFYGGAVISSNKELIDQIESELKSFSVMKKTKVFKRTLGCFIKSIMSSNLIFTFFTFPLIWFAKKFNIRFILKNLETELDLSLQKKFPETYKEQMLPIQAELLLKNLHCVPDDNRERVDAVKVYYNILKDVEGLELPPFVDDGSCIYTCYPIQCAQREEMVEYLFDKGFDVAVQHIKNCSELDSFKDYGPECTTASRVSKQVIMLPTYPGVGIDNVTAIAEEIKSKMVS